MPPQSNRITKLSVNVITLLIAYVHALNLLEPYSSVKRQAEGVVTQNSSTVVLALFSAQTKLTTCIYQGKWLGRCMCYSTVPGNYDSKQTNSKGVA